MNKEERQDALDALQELADLANKCLDFYPKGKTVPDILSLKEIVSEALQSAQISETQLESEIKKTAMSETQDAFPDFIYVGRVRGDRLICFEADESDETKYIRADIQSRQPKLERVDLETLKRVHPIRDRANGFYSSASHEVDGYNSAIHDLKAKYGELYAEVKE